MKETSRRRLLWLASCAVASAIVIAIASCSAAPDHPSVILITLDTTRADHLGMYGYSKPTSPNLDALAASGVVFESAISAAANTPVSHASILTGLFPYRHGLRVLHGTSHNQLPDSVATLAEHLSDAGYHSGAFVSAFPVAERFGLDQGFSHYDADFLIADDPHRITQEGTVNTGANQRRADATTNRAIDWLDEQRGPVFLWTHYFDPHDILVLPPKEFFDPKTIEGVQRTKLKVIYDEEIRYMDREIGRLLDALAAREDLANAIVVVVADHGEGLGDHDWWTHGILYQEQIRVPLIIAAPRMPTVPVGRRVPFTVRTVDIVPTVLELAGLRGPAPDEPAEPDESFDGRSLVPLFSEDAANPELVAYSDSFSPMTYQTPTLDPMIIVSDSRDDILASLISAPFKYIHHLRKPEASELYRLDEDPKEATNWLAREPEVAKRMRGELDARDWMPEIDAPETPMTPDDIERLRALGYLGEAEPVDSMRAD